MCLEFSRTVFRPPCVLFGSSFRPGLSLPSPCELSSSVEYSAFLSFFLFEVLFVYVISIPHQGWGLNLWLWDQESQAFADWVNQGTHLWHFLNVEHFFPLSPKFLLVCILSIPWNTSFLRPSLISSPPFEFPCHFDLFFSVASRSSRKSEREN